MTPFDAESSTKSSTRFYTRNQAGNEQENGSLGDSFADGSHLTHPGESDLATGRSRGAYDGAFAPTKSDTAPCFRMGLLARIPAHSIARLTELLPHTWQAATSPAEA